MSAGVLFDTVLYNDFCFTMQYLLNAVSFDIFYEIDILDCNVGLIGTVVYILQLFTVIPANSNLVANVQ